MTNKRIPDLTAAAGYAVMVWPILMVTLREVTTGALSDK